MMILEDLIIKQYAELPLLSLVSETPKACELLIEGLEEPIWVPKKLTLGVSYQDELVYIESWFLDKLDVLYLYTIDSETLETVIF